MGSTHSPSVHSAVHTPSVRSRAGSTQSSASRVTVPRRVGASFTSYNISGALEERRGGGQAATPAEPQTPPWISRADLRPRHLASVRAAKCPGVIELIHI